MPRTALAALLAAALAVSASACKKKEAKPAPATPAPAAAQPAATPRFGLKDLAAATAADARFARLSLAGSELQAALPAEGAAKPASAKADAEARGRARALLPAVESALAETRAAVEAIAHPFDRARADAALSTAQGYAAALAAAVEGKPGSGADLLGARELFGRAIVAYRTVRASWRVDAPEPTGAEKEFAEARREAERIETAFGSRTRVAPREEGHEFDPSTARMTGQMAARRAKEAAARLQPPLQEPAVRQAAAQERALEAMLALQTAPDAERPAIARRYHAAKAESLAALADYVAALAAR
jgi:hypothetical protein